MNSLTESEKARIKIVYGVLRSLDFKNVDRKFCEKHPELDVKEVKEEFFRFLSLGAIGNIAPPKIVDDYWHEFILHTKKYDEYCKSAFGKFIHHSPNDGSKIERKKDTTVFWSTVQKYEDTFGEPDLPIWGIERRKK